jgi:hypothetical protein
MQGIYKKRARRARRKAILMEFEAEMGAISFGTRRIGGLLRRSFAWLHLPFRTTRRKFLAVLFTAKSTGVMASSFKLP